jgi:hypothetical protein
MFWAPSRSDETPNQVEEPPSHPLFMSAYRSEAKTSSLLWPRTRTVLERLAAEYNANAEREDQNADEGEMLL